MKVCIALNGIVNDYNKTKEIIEKENYDYIIGADGGCNHLNAMGIVPNYIIGDLDSINKSLIEYYESKNVTFKKFPTHKDQTDSEICVHLAKTLNATKIDFIGALGGRIDHALANIGFMVGFRFGIRRCRSSADPRKFQTRYRCSHLHTSRSGWKVPSGRHCAWPRPG